MLVLSFGTEKSCTCGRQKHIYMFSGNGKSINVTFCFGKEITDMDLTLGKEKTYTHAFGH